MKTTIWLLIFSGIFPGTFAQDSTGAKKTLQWNGYLKNMQTLAFDKDFNNLQSGNLIHNRINFKWKPSEHFTAAAEFRNRMTWGDEVRNTPGYAALLRNDNELVNMSVTWINKTSYVFHTNTERLWVEYRRPKWNIRTGRQRINWGIATTWNPSDIFNTYNFLDFDYEERPGSDAVKWQYLFNGLSNLEIAVRPSDKKNQTVAAARFTMNRWGYDFQFIGGLYHNKVTLGLGWAGSIGEVGYKGEGQFYIHEKDSGTSFNYTMELDYVFSKGWYVSAAMLHNENGINEPVNDFSKLNFRFSPLNLMPAKWNIISTVAKEFTPLFSGRVSLVYSPQVNMLIAFPSLSYNLYTNLDADLIWQSFFLELDNRFRAYSHLAFLRLKWSF